MASPGGSCLRSEAQQTDEGWQAAAFYFKLSVVCTCSPTLIRPFGPPSPGGKALAREHPSLAPLLRGAKDEGGSASTRCILILSSIKLRGKDSRKPKRFSWALQGGSGGKSKSPRARFLFVTFSFAEAKEKVMPYPQVSLQ